MNSVTLEGKKGLVAGIANANSIAYGCAKVFRRLGAELAITYRRAIRALRPAPGGRTGEPDHHALRRA